MVELNVNSSRPAAPTTASNPLLAATAPALQVLEVVRRWAARYEAAEAGASPPAEASPSAATADAADAADHCLIGSSVSNSRSGSPTWSGSSGSDAAAPPPPPPPPPAGDGSSSSGRSSEERSAAWQLCTFMQRCGWPVQHCASVRSGSGGAGASSADGWRASSGHEFLLLFPPSGGDAGGRRRRAGAGAGSEASSGGGSSDDAEMADASSALVIDPLFAAQFALASPTPRYQVRSKHAWPGTWWLADLAHALPAWLPVQQWISPQPLPDGAC